MGYPSVLLPWTMQRVASGCLGFSFVFKPIASLPAVTLLPYGACEIGFQAWLVEGMLSQSESRVAGFDPVFLSETS